MKKKKQNSDLITFLTVIVKERKFKDFSPLICFFFPSVSKLHSVLIFLRPREDSDLLSVKFSTEKFVF